MRASHAESSDCPRHSSNRFFFISSLIWGSSNSPAFSFSLLTRGNFSPKNAKPPPFLSSPFANFFIKPSLIWSGGSRIFCGSTKGRDCTLWVQVHEQPRREPRKLSRFFGQVHAPRYVIELFLVQRYWSIVLGRSICSAPYAPASTSSPVVGR